MNPLSGLFGAIVASRNALFDRGILRSFCLNRPVVSVGNISVGGSGKTPFVIALGQLLARRGIRYDVLSRGYHRATWGVRVVDPNGTPADFGDEPILLARRLNIPVIVGESRYEAGRVAERQFDTELHILDDGFQHRALARNFDIVLLTAEDINDHLLPAGRLREPLSSLQRADAVLLPREISTLDPALGGKTIWRIGRNLILEANPRHPIAFCGIARPQQFFAQLRAAGLNLSAEIVFPDHHPYTRNDIDRLLKLHQEKGASGFVSTEKDAINLGGLAKELQPLWIAALQVTIEKPAEVVDTILARIAEQKVRS